MYALEIKQLKKIYANNLEALKGIDLNVATGDFFALLGANGAGKSTTIGLISTLLTKTSGNISVCGYDIDREPSLAKACLGLVPQEFNLNIFERPEEILINQAGYYGIPPKEAKSRAQELLARLGLKKKRDVKVRELSGGMKRRLMIARGLIHRPRVLILDEPTAGVDVEIRHSMWDFLTQTNEQGTTIILTTHYLEEAERLCKNIAIIDRGQIIKSASMNNLLKNFQHQTFIFSTEEPISKLPIMKPFEGKLIDSNTFELRIDNQYTLNDVFEQFKKHNIRIHSLRNKSNRLEELFLDLIKNAH